jgi:hypothetical protein
LGVKWGHFGKKCGFYALAWADGCLLYGTGGLTFKHGVAEGFPMKKLTIVLIAFVAVASLAGCVGKGKGKGKAPPPAAVVTKG